MRSCISVFLFLNFFCQAQTARIPNAFRWPVDTAVVISGNFSEIRLNHLHYGIDISTGGKEGMKILAADDGWVSRVKIGTGGYGKVIYIDHANGFTTVYGHLRTVEDSLGRYLRNLQYREQRFEVEYFPKKNEFPVKKGQVIGRSGNTGFSSGPHLHFEIRRTSTEKVINPCLFGLLTSDTVSPDLAGIGIDPLSPLVRVNGYPVSRKFPVRKKKGKYRLDSKDTIQIEGGAFGISLKCWDRESRKNSRNGLYSLEMRVDGKRAFYYRADSFSFPESRAANAHMDYAHFLDKLEIYEKCYIEKCDPLSFYDRSSGNGILYPSHACTLQIRIEAKDFSGNASFLEFPLRFSPGADPAPPPVQAINCDSGSTFTQDYCKVVFPPHTFYADKPIKFVVQQKKIEKNCLVPNVVVFLPSVPAHETFELSLPIPAHLPVSESKLTMVRVDEKGKRTYAGGTVGSGWITEKFRTFGRYSISFDTLAPGIKTLNIPSSLSVNQKKTLQFRLTDDLSGIASWEIQWKGSWVLSEYEPKQDLLFIPADTLSKGLGKLSVRVTDRCGNIRVLELELQIL